jgi:hypothetical protein
MKSICLHSVFVADIATFQLSGGASSIARTRHRRIELKTRLEHLEEKMSSASYRKMIESYEMKFDTLIAVFIKQLVDTARSSVTTFESHLLNLVTRLDYNCFFGVHNN